MRSAATRNPSPLLPPFPTDEELGDDEALIAAVAAWAERIVTVYRLLKGDRAGEIRGRRPRLLDDRGLHPVSYGWGRAEQIWADRVLPAYRAGWERAWEGVEHLDDGEAAFAEAFYLPFSLGALRQAARADAEGEFAESIREEVDPWA